MKPRRHLCVALLVSAAIVRGPAKSGSDHLGQPQNDAGVSARNIACSSDKPTVWPQEEITVRAWVTGAATPTRFTWTASAGRIVPQETEARWSLVGVAPGIHVASVRTSDAGTDLRCDVRVIVHPRGAGRGRESGWSLLVAGRNEEPQYGLYSYLLLGAPPTDTTRELYRTTIEAYVRVVPDMVNLERYLARRELNITYVPVTVEPATAGLSARWLLDHYDYARARVLLGKLSGDRREGPYIVSSVAPLTARTKLSGPYLFQDFSRTPPHLSALWAREFFNQAAQERFWQEHLTVRRLALNLRTTLAVLASGLPDVRIGVDDRIAWIR